MMISAVAARKAAKAAVESSTTPSLKPSSPPSSRAPSPPSTKPKNSRTPKSSEKPASKRKTRSSSNVEPSTKKKPKFSHPATKKSNPNARYFDVSDLTNARDGHGGGSVVMVDDDDDDPDPGLSSESDASSGEDIQIEVGVAQQVGFSMSSVTKPKRAWSPSRPQGDSSKSEDEEPTPCSGPSSTTFDPVAYATPSTSRRGFEPIPLSTFRPVLNQNVYLMEQNEGTPSSSSSGRAVILVLRAGDTVALVGTYVFRVVQGNMSVLGVTLSASDKDHTLFAPRSSPIPLLSWVAGNRTGPASRSCTYPLPLAIREESNSTAVLIRCTETGIEGLGRICKVFENAFKPPRELGASSSVELPGVHIVLRNAKDIHPFVLSTSWEKALASIDEKHDSNSDINVAPICLVKGPKKSGKSTFARTLVNRLLNRYHRVAFLECDLGQSEFTPGGMVALNIVENYIFGPPFTHPSLPYRAHYVGATSPRSNPSYYLDAIQAILETYKLDVQFPVLSDDHDPTSDDVRISDAIPLVVNTMGWTKGLGADLNARIEERVGASHVFEIEGGVEERGWPLPIQTQHIPQHSTVMPFIQPKVRRYIKVEGISPEMTNTYHTATDHRHLNILSYFHAVFPEVPPSLRMQKQITAIRWDTSVPLCAIYPYEVDYTQTFDRIYLSGPGYEDVVPSELTRVLNGAIIGLVSDTTTSSPSVHHHHSSSESETPTFLPYTPAEPPPDPASSTCHGLALIRGIPATPRAQPLMHVLTPLPVALLSRSRRVVKGEMELPVWGMLDFREGEEGGVAGVERCRVPYLQWGKGEGLGGERRRVRRNLMRKGQM